MANALDIPGQPDGIDDDSNDVPEVENAARRVRAYVTEFGDGLYDTCAGAPLYGRDLEALCRGVERLTAELKMMRAVAQGNKRHAADLTVLLERIQNMIVTDDGEDLGDGVGVPAGEIRRAVNEPIRRIDGALTRAGE